MDPLTALAIHYGSDKAAHGFSAFYDGLLAGQRDQILKVLEIGVLGGASMRMWHDYLPRATIHGLDIAEVSVPASPRLRVHRGDQASRQHLNRLIARVGADFDLIIDDGGHTMEQQQVSLGFLFPQLRPGGLYVIEDLHTSFAREIAWQKDGHVVSAYPTGIADGGPTTYELVQTLGAGAAAASLYLSAPELAFLQRETERVQIFDRDGDRAHLSSALRRRAA